MITIKNLNKSYGKQHVLHDINLTLEQGQCIGFVGPNGCGKTTLMKCILGLVTPQSGEVLVNGMNVQENQSYRQHIGFMQQNSCFPENMSVRETFRTIQDVRGTNTGLDKELYDAYENCQPRPLGCKHSKREDCQGEKQVGIHHIAHPKRAGRYRNTHHFHGRRTYIVL